MVEQRRSVRRATIVSGSEGFANRDRVEVDEVFHCIHYNRAEAVCQVKNGKNLRVSNQNILHPLIELFCVKPWVCFFAYSDDLVHDDDGLVFGGVQSHDDVGSHCSQRLEVGASHFHTHSIPQRRGGVK
jgi:hypothetical protein